MLSGEVCLSRYKFIVSSYIWVCLLPIFENLRPRSDTSYNYFHSIDWLKSWIRSISSQTMCRHISMNANATTPQGGFYFFFIEGRKTDLSSQSLAALRLSLIILWLETREKESMYINMWVCACGCGVAFLYAPGLLHCVRATSHQLPTTVPDLHIRKEIT